MLKQKYTHHIHSTILGYYLTLLHALLITQLVSLFNIGLERYHIH